MSHRKAFFGDVVGNKLKSYLAAASGDSTELLLVEISLCGFVYFSSIEAAYAMHDPKASASVRALADIVRQAVATVVATQYFEEGITRDMAIGYGIALVGQLLQSYGQTTPKQLSKKRISPSPQKFKKR